MTQDGDKEKDGEPSDADIRKTTKEEFEDAEVADFLMPTREATIFLHREDQNDKIDFVIFNY